MAHFSRIEVALTMKETGLIPLFYHGNLEISKQVVKACYDGGARLLEFTARGDFAHEVFGELNKYEWYLLERKHLNHHFEQFGLI